MPFHIAFGSGYANVASVAIASFSPQVSGRGAAPCTAGGCNLNVSAPFDAVRFAVTADDAQGNELDRDTIELDVGALRGTVSLVFGGTPASSFLSIDPAELSTGAVGQATLRAVAYDTAGERLVGSSPFPAPATISSSDRTGATSLSPGSIASPAQTMAVTYSGASIGPVTFAGGAGITPVSLAIVTPPGMSSGGHALSDLILDSAEELASIPVAPANPAPAAGMRRRAASLSATDLSADPHAFPPVADQTPTGMCAVFSGVYAIRSYQERLDRGWFLEGTGAFGINTVTVFSPTFTYNQPGVSGFTDDGASLMSVARSLVRYGAAPWSVVPWTPGDASTDYRFTYAATVANQYRLRTYERIFSGDLATVKAYLRSGYPIYWGNAGQRRLCRSRLPRSLGLKPRVRPLARPCDGFSRL